MRITVLGWLAILAVFAGVLLILEKQAPAPATNLNQPTEGAGNAEGQSLGS